MKAIILAAGRGERMRPLTDTLPKPLLKIADKSLIEYHIENLVQAGITDLVINHAWLGNKIEEQLEDGSRYGATIQYSKEDEVLETAGGIQRVLHLFDNQPFIAINGDIFTDYPIMQLVASSKQLWKTATHSPVLAHLILVKNPAHNPEGDFYCVEQGVYNTYPTAKPKTSSIPRYTFSGIACYHPNFFHQLKPGKQALGPLLRQAMSMQNISRKKISGEVYLGHWCDIGTPQRLEEIRASMSTL